MFLLSQNEKIYLKTRFKAQLGQHLSTILCHNLTICILVVYEDAENPLKSRLLPNHLSMKNSKKIQLDKLKVSSFVTEVPVKTEQILGGASAVTNCHCTDWRCTGLGLCESENVCDS